MTSPLIFILNSNEPFIYLESEVIEMKYKQFMSLFLALLPALLLFSGCGKQQVVQLVNEMSFSIDGIKEVTIAYDEEDMFFFQSETENLIIQEYMSKNKNRYYANVTQERDSIQVCEGGKPLFQDGFVRYIEVYLPASYQEDIKITSTNGEIDLSDLYLNLKSIRIDCTSGILKIKQATASDIYLSSTSGNLEVGTLAADRIRIDTTQGTVVCARAEGTVSYTSTNGDAAFLSAAGSGTYQVTNSGKLSVIYDDVTGDLSLYNKNGSIELVLPAALDFTFDAIVKNGSVVTNFQGELAVNGDTTHGIVGSNPAITIKTETKNGTIEVTQ